MTARGAREQHRRRSRTNRRSRSRHTPNQPIGNQPNRSQQMGEVTS